MFLRGLEFHNTKHSNPLQCKYCNKKFSRVCSYQLKVHENIHEGKLLKKRKRDESMNEIIHEKKKIKFKNILFSPKIVSGIKMPFLPKGFKPIPDYESDYNSNSNSNSSKFDETYNLVMLANVIDNLENL